MKNALIVISIVLSLLYTTKFDAIISDLRSCRRFSRKVYNTVKYQVVKAKYGETTATWACIFDERLGE